MATGEVDYWVRQCNPCSKRSAGAKPVLRETYDDHATADAMRAKGEGMLSQGAPALYSGRSEDRPFKGLRISLFGQVPSTSNAIAVSVTGLFVLGICVQRLAFIGPHFLAVCRLDQ